MTNPKDYANIRTVTLPQPVLNYLLILAFGGLVALMALAGLGIYFGVVLANRPDVPLQAPDKPSTVTHPKEIKP